jgi:pimeloyl-ACP methyl ester carboxylesterase
MPMQLLTTDLDGPYHYADYGGDGQPLVLVHGIGGSHINWISVAPALTERHHVLAVDQVGFGLTPLAGRRADIASQQLYLDRFITQVAGGRATMVGHSMGGLVAMRQAARSPASVERLGLVDPAVGVIRSSPPAPPTWLMMALGAYPSVGGRLAGLVARSRGTDTLVIDALRRAFAPGREVEPGVLRAHLELEARRADLPTPYRGYIEAWRSMRNQRAVTDAWVEDVLKRIKAPTLLLYGSVDPLIGRRWFDRLARLRPDWEVACLDGVGHDPQLEAPEVFLEPVLRWLRTVAPVATPR